MEVTILDILHAFGVFVLGAAGWFSLEFLGRPIREFFSLRREIRQLMLLHWDDPSPDDLNFYDEEGEPLRSYSEFAPARNAFSNVAARLGAFDQGEFFASWTVKKMGFDLPHAAQQLRDMGSIFGTAGERREARFMKIDSALKFSIKKYKRTFYSPYSPAK